MKKYKINEFEYELVNNYKDGFDLEAVKEKVTEYFDNFDYIMGLAYEKEKEVLDQKAAMEEEFEALSISSVLGMTLPSSPISISLTLGRLTGVTC